MMRERQLREGASPEEEAEEAPYTADWEGIPQGFVLGPLLFQFFFPFNLILFTASQGYPEETYPEFGIPSRKHRFPSVILEEPDQVIPTAEELAERMEKEEEEEDEPDDACTDEEVKVENNEGEKEEDDKDEEEYEEEEEEDVEEEEEDVEEEEEDVEEEEEDEDEIGEDQPCLPKSIDEDDEKLEYPGEKEEEQKPSRRRRQITFSDHRHVFHYPKGGAVGCKYEEEEEEEHDGEEEEDDDDEGNEEEENGDDEDCEEEEEEEEDQRNEDGQGETEKEEEDPLMEAESLGFNDEVECDPEEQEVDLINFLQTYQPEVTVISNKSESPKAQASGTLRMRHKKQKVTKWRVCQKDNSLLFEYPLVQTYLTVNLSCLA